MQMYQGEFPCVGATVFVLSMAVAGSLVLSSPATYQFCPRIPTDSTSLRPELVYPQNRFGQSACFFPARRYGFAIRESGCLLLLEKRGLNLTSMGRLRHSCRMGRSDITPQLELGKSPDGGNEPRKRVTGVFWIILLNLGLYVVDHLIRFPGIKALYLYHGQPSWYQFITATFCHANWEHLSSNLFFLYIFGKLVEEEEGNFGLWISYILTGAGANIVSWLVLPRSAVSVGASGAVFGLFAISVLVKMSWDWRKILEVLILGPFVIQKVMQEAQASTGLVGSLSRGSSYGYVNHIAHLSGALIGAALVYLVSRIPSQSSDDT